MAEPPCCRSKNIQFPDYIYSHHNPKVLTLTMSQEMTMASNGMEMVLSDAVNMASSMPMPVFGSDIPPEFAQALMSSAKQQYLGNAMLLANFKRSFVNMLDVAVQQVTEETKTQIVESEVKVKNYVRSELQQAQIAVNGRLDEMKRSIDAQDPITQAWRTPANIYLRQIMAWILFMGIDTTTTHGMTPLINFSFYPGRPHTEENHLTVLSKALIRMLFIHKNKFTPAVINGIQTKIEAIITPIFNCITTLTQKETRKLAAMFPSKLYVTGGVYIFRTQDLIRLMQEELKYQKLDQSVLDTRQSFHLKSRVSNNGTLDITKGVDAATKKTIMGKFRELVGIGPSELYSFARSILKKEQDTDKIYNFVAVRRYWGMPASKEHLQQECLHMGVSMIRRDVFRQTTPAFNPVEPFHIGLNWELDTKHVVEPFSTVISRYLEMEDSDFLSDFALTADAQEDHGGDDDTVSQPSTPIAEPENDEQAENALPPDTIILPKHKIHTKNDFPKIKIKKSKRSADEMDEAYQPEKKKRKIRKNKKSTKDAEDQESKQESSDIVTDVVSPPPPPQQPSPTQASQTVDNSLPLIKSGKGKRNRDKTLSIIPE
jgi:hypothetical protein